MTEKVIKGVNQNGKPNACTQRNMCKHKQHSHWQGDHYDIHGFFVTSSLEQTELHQRPFRPEKVDCKNKFNHFPQEDRCISFFN